MPFCSNIQVKHGSTTLLSIGDRIDANPSIDGGQIVETVPIVRADGVSVFPRGNESHTLEWTAADKVVSAHTAARSVLSHATNLPKGRATVTITVDDNAATKFQLRDAVVQSWPASWGELREARTYSIVGSLMIEVTYTADTDAITADNAVITADTQ